MKFKKYFKSKTAWIVTLIIAILVAYQEGDGSIFSGFLFIIYEKSLFGIFILVISYLGGLFLEKIIFRKKKLKFGFSRGRN